MTTTTDRPGNDPQVLVEDPAPGQGDDATLREATRAERRGVLREMRAHRRARAKAKADEKAAQQRAWAGLDPHERQGPRLRDHKRAAKRGAYAPQAAGAPTTTRQGEILNPAVLAAPTGPEGIAVGVDKLTRTMVTHDPFTAYRAKQISSPGVIVLGLIGSGKSSLVKTVYVLRPLTFRRRRAVVVDRKDMGGVGEYTDVTGELGGNHFPFRIGADAGGCTLNPLDPQILEVIGVARQRMLLRGMIERVNGVDLNQWERKGLRTAHQLLLRRAEHIGRAPVLEDLIPLLGNMDHDLYADFSAAAKERVHEAGLGVRFLLEELLSEELDGLFNGPTSAGVNLDAKLTSFDISQLPESGPAAGLVMSVAQAWVIGQIRRDRGWATTFVVEEGWDMLSGSIGRTSKAMMLLARGWGLSMVSAMQHIRQVRDDSEAREMLQEPQTVHLYKQEREEDVQDCITNFGLDPQSADTLRNQPAGSHLLKIGSRPEIAVRHVRSDWEKRITDTDNQMQGWAS